MIQSDEDSILPLYSVDKASSTDYCPILYPAEIKSATQRKLFKQKLLQENPESLFADLYKNGDVSNLIFFTKSPCAWHHTIAGHYPSVKKEGISHGWKIKIRDPCEQDNFMTTVNIFKNGSIMIQGNIRDFQTNFLALKTEASKQASATEENNMCKSSEENKAEQLSPSENEQVHTLQLSLDVMKEHFSKLEIEFVQLKELMTKQQAEQEAQKTKYNREMASMSVLIEDLLQERDSVRKELYTQKNLLKELKEERDCYKRDLTAVRGELRDISNTIQFPQEQMNSLTELHHQRSERPSLVSQDPSVPSNTLITSQNVDRLNQPSERPETERGRHKEKEEDKRANIVFLIDSNGKFINEKRLFPRHNVSKLRCPTTEKALELLSPSRLGSPSHIIIHTGTNDLMTQQERVANSLINVISKACNTFPHSKVVISAVLPRTDFQPHIIQRINATLARVCASHPNVHLAHHPNIGTDCLFDHVHLLKEAVPIFTKNLKDATFGRKGKGTGQAVRQPLVPSRRSRHTALQKHPHIPSGAPWQGQPVSRDNLPPITAPLHRTENPLQLTQQPVTLSGQATGLDTTTYAQALSASPGNTSGNLKDIHSMLGIICAHLFNHNRW